MSIDQPTIDTFAVLQNVIEKEMRAVQADMDRIAALTGTNRVGDYPLSWWAWDAIYRALNDLFWLTKRSWDLKTHV